MLGMAGRDGAVVIGSGIAGLTAAKVLADRFAKVVVLDRDDLPDGADPRPHVPQSGHAHVLLTAGLNGLEVLFPGIGTELVDNGGSKIDAVADLHVYRGRLFPRTPSGIWMVCFSRPLLEQLLRRRLKAVPNVDIRP